MCWRQASRTVFTMSSSCSTLLNPMKASVLWHREEIFCSVEVMRGEQVKNVWREVSCMSETYLLGMCIRSSNQLCRLLQVWSIQKQAGQIQSLCESRWSVACMNEMKPGGRWAQSCVQLGKKTVFSLSRLEIRSVELQGGDRSHHFPLFFLHLPTANNPDFIQF